jgi:anti-anti-sigma factor
MRFEPPTITAITGEMRVIEVTGEHDLSTLQMLRDPLDEALCRASAVIVDLEHATFIDSSVVGVILRAARVADQRLPPLVFLVCAPLDSPARRVLDLVSLGLEVTIVDRRLDAMRFVQTLR